MSKGQGKKRIYLSKRSGAALLGIVLVGLIVLAIVSAVAISIGWNASRIEAWQTQNLETRRLDAIARSAANMVAETISNDVLSGNTTMSDDFGTAVTDSVSSPTTLIVTEPSKTYLTITINCDADNNGLYRITSVASSDQGSKVTVYLERIKDSNNKYVMNWGKGK